MQEVFKTNVHKKTDGKQLLLLLELCLPAAEINFDLQDQDRILRVCMEPTNPARVIELLNGQGFLCVELED